GAAEMTSARIGPSIVSVSNRCAKKTAACSLARAKQVQAAVEDDVRCMPLCTSFTGDTLPGAELRIRCGSGSDPVTAGVLWMSALSLPQEPDLMCIVRSFIAASIVLSSCVAAPRIHARDFNVGTLQIIAPWILIKSAGSTVGSGYMRILNSGSEPDRLVSAES